MGKFTVKYKASTALLSWPRIFGDFTKQTIQKKTVTNKIQAFFKCDGDCVEEEVPSGKTTHSTAIDPKRMYKFRLVLYDGDVVVYMWENPETTGTKHNHLPLFKTF